MKQNKSIKEILERQKELVDECKSTSPLWNELSRKISRSIQSLEALEQQLPVDKSDCSFENARSVLAGMCGGDTMNEQLINDLLKVEKDITELYAKKAELLSEFPKSFPNNMAIKQNGDSTWSILTLTDNAEKINEGSFKTVRVERFSLKIETLKNMPKELKEVSQ
jgi:hypothetical protein